MTSVQAVELDLLSFDLEAADVGVGFDHAAATIVMYLDREGLGLPDFNLPTLRRRWWPGFFAALLASSTSLNAGGARILALARSRP